MQKSGLSVKIKVAYLSELDSEEIRGRLLDKVKNGEVLTGVERRWIKMTDIGRMFEQEKEDAVKVAEAKTLVADVERTAKGFSVSVEEACKKMGIAQSEYPAAKEMVEGMLVGAA